MKVTCLQVILFGLTVVSVSITSIHCENNQDCINCSDRCFNDTGYCNGSCTNGFYGSDCNSTCPNNCYYRCDRITGECTNCKTHYYGVNCTESCSERCHDKYCNQSGICLSCKSPYYGDNCDKNCPSNCNAVAGCDRQTGECSYGCNYGFWGNYCENNCSDRCKSACQRHYGTCWGCKPGFGGSNCQFNCIAHCDSCSRNDTCYECSKGWFGEKCELRCPVNCRNSICSMFDGSCSCSKGWYGKDCNDTCIDNCDSCIDNTTCNVCSEGYYGRYCESSCPSNCTKCERSGEKCTRCNSGLFGDQCTCDVDQCFKHESGSHCVECKHPGWYPKIGGCCRCSDNCIGGHLNCDNTTGLCLDGCEPGYYGTHCVDKCSSHCIGNDTVCNSTTGVCPYGCEPDWFYSTCKYGCSLLTPHCSKCSQFKDNINSFKAAGCDECDSGFYKPILEKFCARCENCLYDECNGRTGRCLKGCEVGWYENPYSLGTCDRRCDTSCIDGLCDPTNGTCIHGCKDGWTGDSCRLTCSSYCLNKTCDQFSGDCIKCNPGYYGHSCYFGCVNCIGGTCNQTTGICEDGCMDGHFGPRCSRLCNNCIDGKCDRQGGCTSGCMDGNFGRYCNKSCSQCLGGKCDLKGVCMSGCTPGKYGRNCAVYCPENCLICHSVTGRCLHISPPCNNSHCTMNFTNSVCPPSRFGFNCNQTCSKHCKNSSSNGYICEKYSGTCIEPCATGQFGQFCNKSCGKCALADNTLTSCNSSDGHCINCLNGYYGKQCFQKCSESCLKGKCKGNGMCSQGCKPEWKGTFCEVKQPAKQTGLSSGSVTGISIGCVVTVILIVVLAYFIYRRRSNKDNAFSMKNIQY
ncbi:multiple epidermal growth factor-like domains protein 6 [Mytilus edulis]|uniref:multiple epidermal growth factor-like domains protein 6 n=1 Tax=Mytilus edulis TaxID=6550 RepID=UPI0039EECF0A